MGASAICFGLFVILVIILGTENEVNAAPAPAPIPAPDICMYRHRHGSSRREPTTSTAVPSVDKAKDQRKEKLKTFWKLLEEFFDMDKDAEKKKKEETEKKKKEEAEKKKKEEAEKKKIEEAKGFGNIGDVWNSYVQFITSVYNYSFEN